MTYEVHLQSEPSETFRCVKAANSVDLDLKKKLRHDLTVTADLKSPFFVGAIIGNSGSGKTTLAKSIWGGAKLESILDPTHPIIDQFPDGMTYEDCVRVLNGIGLSQVPCWVRPAVTLSNGQRFRAEAALHIARACFGGTPATPESPIVIDEWTSVVDRTVGKVMSHCVQKMARRYKTPFVLCSCHYDVIEWLAPDWIVDCNRGEYEDRRSLRQERSEHLHFDIREIDGKSWRYFNRYHYLSENLPGGRLFLYGLFHGQQQIGFQCFANYVPSRKMMHMFHFNRTVIHPDYVGLGLGIELIDRTSAMMKTKGYEIMGKFTSTPIYKAMIKRSTWRLEHVELIGKVVTSKRYATDTDRTDRNSRLRHKVKSYSFRYIGPAV